MCRCLSTFQTILSALQAPTCKSAKYLVPILEPLTTSKYVVKNSFNFVTEIVEKDPATSRAA